MGQWKADLAAAQQESQQLGEEIADQLEQLEQLERRCIELESELKVAQLHSEELTATLEAERAHAAQEQAQWKEEFKGMRDLLDKQCSLLATQLKPSEKPTGTSTLPEKTEDLTARRLKLRQRAQKRLADKQSDPQESDSEEPAES